MELEILMGILLAGVGLLGVIAWRERPERSLQTVELRFGTDLTVETAAALLGCLAGLPASAAVMFDVVAGEGDIRYYFHAAPQTLDSLRSQWRGILPSVRFDEPGDHPPVAWRLGALLRLGGSYPVLRDEASSESVGALLGALQPLSAGEHLLVRWVWGAGGRPPVPEPVSRREELGNAFLLPFLPHKGAPSADHARLLRAKYAGPVLAGVGVVAVAAGHPKRAAHLLSRVISPLRSRGGAYGRIVAHRREGKRLERLLEVPVSRPRDLYSPAELVGAIGLPVGSPRVPGLTLGTAPLLMPSPGIPSEGRVLAVSTWPGLDRRLAQPVVGGMSHTLVVGPTGVGKSALIANLAVKDLEAGRGCLVLDGKGGDLADDIMARVPSRRLADVIAVDPGSDGPIPGLRLFGHGADVETTADLVLGIFESLFASTWGPMSAKWLRAALVAVAHDPSGTLADVPFVFTDDAYRRRLVARIDDVLLKSTFAAYDAMSAQERLHQVAAPMGKLAEIVGRRVVRGVLAQTNPSIDMHDVLRTGKVVIVSLAPARIGPAARLIAALVVYKFFEGVLARAAVPASQRGAFFAYIDEPRVLGDIPVPIDSLFELARSANIGVVLSAQSISQLTRGLRAAATTNAASWVVFRQSSTDAKLLSAELPNVSSEALQNLRQYEVVMRLGLGPGDVSAPVTGRTLPLPVPTSDPVAVRRASASRYGTDPAEVDAALAKRHEATGTDETPVGFLRRQP